MLVKVKETSAFMKDTESGAIVNIDRKGNNEYKRKKALINNDRIREKEMSEIKCEMDSLKNDLSEIKNLLKELTCK